MSFTGSPEEFLEEVLALPRVVAESVSPDLSRVTFSWAGRGDAVDAFVTPVEIPARSTLIPNHMSVFQQIVAGLSGSWRDSCRYRAGNHQN